MLPCWISSIVESVRENRHTQENCQDLVVRPNHNRSVYYAKSMKSDDVSSVRACLAGLIWLK